LIEDHPFFSGAINKINNRGPIIKTVGAPVEESEDEESYDDEEGLGHYVGDIADEIDDEFDENYQSG